jgi:hypothetical protein
MRLATILIAGLLMAATAHAHDLVRVYVKPVELAGGFTDDDTKQRQDSTVDLRKALAGKDKTLVLVASPDDAQVTIEVLDRGQVATDTTVVRRDIYGTIQGEHDRAKIVRVRLSVGEYSTEIAGASEPTPQFGSALTSWRGAAGAAAASVDRWIKANRAKFGQ